MKQQEDRLEELFAAVQGQPPVPDNGFSARVMRLIEAERPVQHLAMPQPPRRSFYRVPTLATALASAVLLAVIYFTGFDTLQVLHDLKARSKAYWEQLDFVPKDRAK